MQIFKICVAQSKLSNVKSFAEVPLDSLFSKFVEFVHHGMSCNFLASKIKTWFNENCGKVEKHFSFRFRGKESFLYMKHFPALIKMILVNISNIQVKKHLHQLHYQSIQLREVLSYSVRIEEFNEQLLSDMKLRAKLLFKSCCLFEQRISPSLWTLCNAAPYHAGDCLEQYGLGLGCNTMEGREQKHQRIAKYAQNTTFQNRWPLTFRHEFLQLVYLREHGFDRKKYLKKKVSYIPGRDENCCSKCCLELFNGKCSLCDSEIMTEIELSLSKK